MERLTEHYGERYIRIKGCNSFYPREERKSAPASNAVVRLAAYEDTGLAPEEINNIVAVGGCYCRECIYGIQIDKSDEIRCCEYHDFTVWPKDGYCSYGQRREEADNGEIEQ